MNVFNDNAPLSGFGLYCRLNRNLQTISQALISDPPVHSNIIGVDSISLVADTTAGTLISTFAPVIDVTQYLMFYFTKPVSAGVNFVKSEYRLVKILAAADILPFDFASFYITVFGALPAIGEKVFVKAKPIIIATGQDGIGMEASDIAV